MNKKVKTLIQCDFDGTITEGDVSFQILDAFAVSDWRHLLAEYTTGRITVGDFNAMAFDLVKTDEKTMINFVKTHAMVRSGFKELISFCAEHGIRFVVTSNGLDFYIKYILDNLGLDRIEIFAAETRFSPDGVKVRYIGPGGNVLTAAFKESHTKKFIKEGYRLIYIGNGLSDFPAARLCYHIFAREDLQTHCLHDDVLHTPFNDFYEVVDSLKSLGI